MARVLRSFVFMVVVLSAVIATPAQAQTVDECQAAIASLSAATVNAVFTARNADKDQAALLGKLDSAETKLEQGKFADSLQALTQFQAKVVSLNEQGKIDPADATTLLARVDNAISCVGSLSA